MPISKDQARQIIERLSQGAPLEALGPRLAPISEEQRPFPPDVPRPMDWSEEARHLRVEMVERVREVKLPHLTGQRPAPDPESLRGSIEQQIGMVQLPVGLIGPLRVAGFHAHGDYYVPLATTEGALVASYHRGARLVTRAGGAAAITTTEQVQRAPGFAFATLAEAAHFAAWSTGRFEIFQAVAKAKSKHGRLTDLKAHVEANHVYLIFDFHTGDASGRTW
jgi:hydroxymethylglutaryl-CoA reductase (NADPH)